GRRQRPRAAAGVPTGARLLTAELAARPPAGAGARGAAGGPTGRRDARDRCRAALGVQPLRALRRALRAPLRRAPVGDAAPLRRSDVPPPRARRGTRSAPPPPRPDGKSR